MCICHNLKVCVYVKGVIIVGLWATARVCVSECVCILAILSLLIPNTLFYVTYFVTSLYYLDMKFLDNTISLHI